MFTGRMSSDIQDVVGPLTFMNGLPTKYSNHIKKQGAKAWEDQIRIAQGFYDVENGITWKDPASKKEPTEDNALVPTLL